MEHNIAEIIFGPENSPIHKEYRAFYTDIILQKSIFCYNITNELTISINEMIDELTKTLLNLDMKIIILSFHDSDKKIYVRKQMLIDCIKFFEESGISENEMLIYEIKMHENIKYDIMNTIINFINDGKINIYYFDNYEIFMDLFMTAIYLLDVSYFAESVYANRNLITVLVSHFTHNFEKIIKYIMKSYNVEIAYSIINNLLQSRDKLLIKPIITCIFNSINITDNKDFFFKSTLLKTLISIDIEITTFIICHKGYFEIFDMIVTYANCEGLVKLLLNGNPNNICDILCSLHNKCSTLVEYLLVKHVNITPKNILNLELEIINDKLMLHIPIFNPIKYNQSKEHNNYIEKCLKKLLKEQPKKFDETIKNLCGIVNKNIYSNILANLCRKSI